MNAITFNTSLNGYWRISCDDIQSEEIQSLSKMVNQVFENQGKFFCYYPGSIDDLPLQYHHLSLTPVLKYVACRESLRFFLEILSFAPMQIVRKPTLESDGEIMPKPDMEEGQESSQNQTLVNVSSLEEFDKFVTDDSVLSILFAQP